MHQPVPSTPSPGYKLWLARLGLLLLGVLLGREFFPLEVPKLFVVEKEKRVEIPVERVVEKRVEVPVVRIVEKRV